MEIPADVDRTDHPGPNPMTRHPRDRVAEDDLGPPVAVEAPAVDAEGHRFGAPVQSRQGRVAECEHVLSREGRRVGLRRDLARFIQVEIDLRRRLQKGAVGCQGLSN